MRSQFAKALTACWLLLLLLLTGCASMAERVGIASSESVDRKLAETRSELEAQIMESRLEQMPRDTIEELVVILQRYLAASEESQ